MNPRRFRAPSHDGGVLADPPLSEYGRALESNLRLAAAADIPIQGRSLPALRTLARRELFAASSAYLGALGFEPPEAPEAAREQPVVVSGHQPELFHPGVWIKNFAIAAIARRSAAASLHVIVDNDVPKSASIRVPSLQEGTLRTMPVDFDTIRPQVPYEEWAVNDCGRFRSFPDRVHETLGALVSDPLIDQFWPLVLGHTSRMERPRVSVGFSAARRQIESEWGARNWEVSLSSLCQTDSFYWFLSHIIAQLPRFHAVHNDALAAYRRANRIRSRNHPVPELAVHGEWREAPFWGWRAGNPRRHPVLARHNARTIDLQLHGENEPFVTLPLSASSDACCAVERLRELTTQGIKIRSRALTTTLFSRLFVGDLFVHGIGGAKYDELGDAIISGFYDLTPPSFLALSITLWLGLAEKDFDPRERLAVGRLERDLVCNPDRVLGEQTPSAARTLIDAKRRAIGLPQGTRRERVARFREIRCCNEALAPFAAPRAADLAERRARLESNGRWNDVAHSRDFSAVLHSQTRLRRAIESIVFSLESGPAMRTPPLLAEI
jgi:hypothetical protein